MKKGGSANLNMMNQIATDLVVEQAVNDKLKYYEDQEKAQSQPEKLNNINEDYSDQENEKELSDCSVSSGEREVMRNYKEKVEAKCYLEGTANKETRKELTGSYLEKSEKEFFDLIEKKKDRIVCHFYHDNFVRCKLLDKELALTAYDHPESLFIRINAQTAPFIVTKLMIKVLPAIYFFKNGNVKDMIVGFEEFGNDDNFKRGDFLTRLAKYGGLDLTPEENFRIKKKPKQQVLGESDDSDEN